MGLTDGESASQPAAAVSRLAASRRGARRERFPRPAPQDARRGRASSSTRTSTRDRVADAGESSGRDSAGRRRRPGSNQAAAADGRRRSSTGTSCSRPRGTETRLGQALRQLIHDERGTPLSGIVVLSDGGQNAGISPEAAVELAREAKIPIFTVGLGSDRQPTNVPRVATWPCPPGRIPATATR